MIFPKEGWLDEAEILLYCLSSFIYYSLQNISEIAVHSAEDLLQDINLGIMDADSILLNLTVAKDLALAVLNMSLPPLASAEDLARQINRSIIPDDIVQDIVDNATASRMIAEEALAMAQAAR